MSDSITSGVSTHSTETAFNWYIIFCVGNDIAQEAAFKAWAFNNDVPYKSMYGAYNGVMERCFIVNYAHAGKCWTWFKNEETILILKPLWDAENKRMLGARPAHLLYLDYRRNKTPLGYFSQQTREYALKQPAYTYDPSTNTYWVAE